MQFIDDVNDSYWQGKRVLLRVGFDMGKEFAAMEEFRIKKGLSSITHLLKRGVSLVLLNHNGRPAGKADSELSNARVAKKLGEFLQREVPLIPLGSKEAVSSPLVLLENLRFDPREETGDSSFAHELAQLGDAYVNDAFSNSHRAHTSMTSLALLLPHFGGLQLRQELEVLGEVLNNPMHPLLLIIGGLKIETKMKMVKRFWDKVEGILLGGALANTFLHAKGIAVGKSVIEPSYLGDIKDIPLTDTRLHLPVDVRAARDFEGKEGLRISGAGKLKDDEIILDIGPDTEI
ncbi:MAG: phosphoglycerate kinase, partial [Candidatus Portnoybacteria bacterium]|nr:phosphoglycerate kinase [Candidatus Portnoybacteria bacterium]